MDEDFYVRGPVLDKNGNELKIGKNLDTTLIIRVMNTLCD
jgi:hypothetical protein